MEPRRTAEISKVMWDFDVEEAKDRIVSELFEDLNGNLERYISDPQDDEAVHDIRVEIRKLISLLYFFKPLIDEEKERGLRRGLKDVLKSFGSIREGDMLVKSVREFVKEEKAFQTSAEAVIQAVGKGRAEDVEESLERIGSDELHDRIRTLEEELLRDDLLRNGASDRGRGADGKVPDMEAYALERFREILGKLKAIAEADDFKDISEVHAFRIRCKKASYSLMMAETVTALDGEDWIGLLKEIQDVTGNIHDAEVNKELLEDMQVEDRKFEKAYKGFLDGTIRKKMKTFGRQLEDVRKTGLKLKARA